MCSAAEKMKATERPNPLIVLGKDGGRKKERERVERRVLLP
jgi:hypothetical protein